MNRQQPPGPEYQQQMKSVKTESAPVMRQVDVECVAPYREINWQNIGREAAGMSPESVQYSQGLRPPGHLTSFVRMVGKSTKGITNTATNTLICVVMEGKVTVMINSSQFVATRGDTFFVPHHNTYNLINMRDSTAELFIVQYKTPE